MTAVVLFLVKCNYLMLSSVVATMLAAILDKMEGGHWFDPSRECDDKHGEGWECVIAEVATNCMDAMPNYL